MCFRIDEPKPLLVYFAESNHYIRAFLREHLCYCDICRACILKCILTKFDEELRPGCGCDRNKNIPCTLRAKAF